MASLDHIGLSVSDFAAAKAFYSERLRPSEPRSIGAGYRPLSPLRGDGGSAHGHRRDGAGRGGHDAARGGGIRALACPVG